MRMAERNSVKNADILMIMLRLFIIVSCCMMFIAGLNPARVSGAINKNASLFTCAISYATIGNNFVRALTRGWIDQQTLYVNYAGALLTGLSIIGLAAAACMSFGLVKLKHLCVKVSVVSSLTGVIGTILLCLAYNGYSATNSPSRIEPMFPMGIWLYFIIFALVLALSVWNGITLPKPAVNDQYEMLPKYRLFLMILPFLIFSFLFAYLPLWGWRYSFFDYKPGFDLSWDTFVGFKWLRYLFSNPATRADIVRVLKNTFGISGIGILTSWLPMAFAIFLSEMRSSTSRRLVQTLTTIPNFISWVLVYTVAFALFSTYGFVNSMLTSTGIIESGTNYLMSGTNIWLKMWLWGTWKGLGWGAIIYLAAISGIDQQLYEAATVDGAGRFTKMWHVTVPGLIPTFFVLLLMSIASILSNGMDQYLVFYNAMNRESIQVLDLFVYQIGLGGGNNNIPLATLIGMLKSVISVTLLFTANKVSALIRGESIV